MIMEKNFEYKSNGNGISFIGALQLVFITLKLTDNIDWSWFNVMLPTIIPVGIFIAILVIGLLYAFSVEIFSLCMKEINKNK